MALPAGQRDKLVQFQRATATRSALGGKSAGSWGDIGSRRARVFFGSGAERRSAAVEGGVQSATFNLLLDSLTRTVTDQDRIVFAGLAFDITGIAPLPGRREIEFTGTASRG